MRVWPGGPYPLGATWDGSGTNFALFSEAAEALLAELDGPAGADARLGAAVASLRRLMSALETTTSLEAQHEARRLAGQIAVTLAAALLVRHAPAPVADAFCASRLEPGFPGGPGAPFGTLPARLDLTAIIDRARAEPPGVA